MQSNSTRDLIVGLFVLVGLGMIAYLSLQVGGLEIGGGNRIVLHATFDDIGGLSVRAPVRVSGVKIGQVSAIKLDEDLRAEVALEVESEHLLSIDSTVAIRTSGLLGDQFIAVELGAEDDSLTDGEAFMYAESAFSIEKLIGRFMNSAGTSD
jgi:phospholipid/cholesterol/gamma-HCH transport system substrate-binding protein